MPLANAQWSSGAADSAVGDGTSDTIFNQYWALKTRPHFPRFLAHDSWILIVYHPNRSAARGIKHSRIGIQPCAFRNYPFVSGQKCPATPGFTAPTTSYLLSKGVYARYDPGLAHRLHWLYVFLTKLRTFTESDLSSISLLRLACSHQKCTQHLRVDRVSQVQVADWTCTLSLSRNRPPAVYPEYFESRHPDSLLHAVSGFCPSDKLTSSVGCSFYSRICLPPQETPIFAAGDVLPHSHLPPSFFVML